MNTFFPAYIETTTPLGISGVFTGSAHDARMHPTTTNPSIATGQAWQTPYTTFNVSLIADQASAANGVVVQGSIDNVTWRNVTVSALVLNVPLNVSIPVTYPLYRVVVTNGVVAQTAISIASSFTR